MLLSVETLNKKFPSVRNGKGRPIFLPLRSPDLTMTDFFWGWGGGGFVKNIVYA
jgi:hypothetical protein